MISTTVIALGNCPSSGSSLLADLLDSTGHTACGPELNLFGIEALYDFRNFHRRYKESNGSSSMYHKRNSLNLHRLFAFGLNETLFLKMIKSSDDLRDFLKNFAKRYLALRGKDINGVVFEKTPQNVHCISEYLNQTNNHFIHIVRNPADVYKSLLRRGLPDKIALITWLLGEAKIYSHLENERVIVIRYEDLVRDPYGIASNLIKKITGFNIKESEIKNYREKNHYRKIFTGNNIKSWRQRSNSDVIKEIKNDFSNIEINYLNALTSLKVSAKQSKMFNLSEVTFFELLDRYGYTNDYIKLTKNINVHDKREIFKLSNNDILFILKKYFLDLKHNDARLADLPAYLSLVEER